MEPGESPGLAAVADLNEHETVISEIKVLKLAARRMNHRLFLARRPRRVGEDTYAWVVRNRLRSRGAIDERHLGARHSKVNAAHRLERSQVSVNDRSRWRSCIRCYDIAPRTAAELVEGDVVGVIVDDATRRFPGETIHKRRAVGGSLKTKAIAGFTRLAFVHERVPRRYVRCDIPKHFASAECRQPFPKGLVTRRVIVLHAFRRICRQRLRTSDRSHEKQREHPGKLRNKKKAYLQRSSIACLNMCIPCFVSARPCRRSVRFSKIFR